MATARMTRAEARRIEADKEIMRYAARNLRMCQMRAMATPNISIAEQTGLSPSRTSRIIAKGEDHWQKWLDRAIEEGIEQEDFLGAVPEPDGERVEMIDVTTIHDNPFQPRKTVLEEDVSNLLADIAQSRLHQPITLRSNGSGLELVLGQLRLMAFRMGAESEVAGAPVQGDAWSKYHDSATGITRIPAVVREMTDEEVIIASLSENLNRNRMVWSDETRALDLAARQTGVTARQVAAAAKMSPQELSNRRRLLRLPAAVLEMVDKDVLAPTSARELLVFATPHHTHNEELDYCVQRLQAKMRRETDGDGNTKRIDARSVRTVITNALCHDSNVTNWEPLIDSNYIYMGDGNSHGKTRPKFDIPAFEGAYREWVHKIPRRYHAGTEDWTCAVQAWVDWQAVAEVEERRAEKEATEQTNRLGAVAAAFSNENPRAEKLPRAILHMLEDSRLSQSFVHRLLGFVKETHAHEGYLEEIADGLKALASDGISPIPDAAAGGIVLKALRKNMDYTQFRSLDDRLTSFGFDAPRFAMDEFIEEMKPVIHNVPIGIGIVRVTCSYDAWDEYQERKSKALKEQVSRGNESASPPKGEPAAQLMDMSMAETADTAPYWAAAPVLMVPKCPPEAGDHWHVMTAVGAPGFADKAKRSPALLTWDDVMRYLEELTDDGGATPWVEEHVYDDR